MEKQRIDWIDVAKCFGIFFIYLGHCGEGAGRSYPFVFLFHVALFFFLSGCTESLGKETDFKTYLAKKIKGLLLPFFMFAAVIILIEMIKMDHPIGTLKYFMILVAKGAIRDTFFAGSLWFLTCLFSMTMVFWFIRKIPNKAVILMMTFGMYIVANVWIHPHPLDQAHWIFNLDSVMYFTIFYALGYVLFPWIKKLFLLDTSRKNIVFFGSGVMALGYSMLLYFGIDILKVLENVSMLQLIVPMIRALPMIWVCLEAANLFKNCEGLCGVGQSTLYLCGSEYIIKTLVQYGLSILGIGISIASPLSAYMYTIVMLYLAYRYLVPVEKRWIKAVQSFCFK